MPDYAKRLDSLYECPKLVVGAEATIESINRYLDICSDVRSH